MSILSKLFGSGGGKAAKSAAEPVIYNDFTIFPDPIAEGGQYRIAARIEKEIDGEVKVHRLIRADTINDADAAIEASVGKARQVIDEQGDAIFRQTR